MAGHSHEQIKRQRVEPIREVKDILKAFREITVAAKLGDKERTQS